MVGRELPHDIAHGAKSLVAHVHTGFAECGIGQGRDLRVLLLIRACRFKRPNPIVELLGQLGVVGQNLIHRRRILRQRVPIP